MPKVVTETKIEAAYGATSTTDALPSPKAETESKVEATYESPSTSEAPPLPKEVEVQSIEATYGTLWYPSTTERVTSTEEAETKNEINTVTAGNIILCHAHFLNIKQQL